MRFVAIVILGLLGSNIAAQVLEGFEDPALQARYTDFIETIRCMMCQNQSIAKSPAEQATDIKLLIREMMSEGRSDAEIREFLVVRYGDFISYQPPFKPATWLVWFAPVLLLAAGGLVFYRVLRTRLAQPLDEAVE